MAKSPALLLVVLLAAAPAHAQSWSLGTHLGLVSIQGRKNAGSSTVTGWPSNTLAYQPGLRVAVGTASHSHEVGLDTGLLFIDEAGTTFSQLAADLSYQYAYHATHSLSPYANAAVGLFREGGSAGASNETSYGIGIGLRRAVSQRHGCIRAEGRVDHLHEDAKTGRPKLTFWGLRLGFDLWL